MPTPTTAHWPKPKSEDEFEDLALDALRMRWMDPHCQRNGRRGQRQNGVDIFGMPPHLSGRRAVAQCKNGQVSITLLRAELEKAKGFGEQFGEFLLVTSMDRDAKLQAELREYLANERPPYRVEVVFWDDLVLDLSSDENLLAKHWKGFPATPMGLRRREPAPVFIDRVSIPDAQCCESHLEVALSVGGGSDIDPIDIVGCIDSLRGRHLPYPWLTHAKGEHPEDSRIQSWRLTDTPFSNVTLVWEMSVDAGARLTTRFSQFHSDSPPRLNLLNLIEIAAVSTWLLACSIERAELREVHLRIAAKGSGADRLALLDDQHLSNAWCFFAQAPLEWEVDAKLERCGDYQDIDALIKRALTRSVRQFSGATTRAELGPSSVDAYLKVVRETFLAVAGRGL